MKPVINFAKAPAMEISNDDRCVIKSVHPENIFTFPEGILGFENINEYIFLMNEKVKPFLFMQALHDSDLSFVCVETFLIRPDYSMKLNDATVNALELKNASDALVLSLVTVRKRIEDITANLISPIVINLRNSKAKQVVLEDSKYEVKYNIWEAIQNRNPAIKVG
jgi:flagellar assembly factor FliW